MKKNHYDSDYFKVRHLLSPYVAKTVVSILVAANFKKILDVGCGSGLLVRYLNQNGFKAIGCDPSKEAVKIAKKINAKGVIFNTGVSKLPVCDNSIELVTAISVVEHLTNKQMNKFLKECTRVLKPKGLIFIITPNFDSPLRLIQGKRWFGYSDPTHINFFTVSELKSLMRKNRFSGFKTFFNVEMEPSLDWELPPAASRLPSSIKAFLLWLIFATPISSIRNSFWLLAKYEKA